MELIPEQSIGLLSKSFTFAFRNYMEELVRPLGLSSMDAFSLMLISRIEDISLAEMARKSGHAHPSVLRHVDKLEAEGLIIRVPHDNDRRIKILKLTERGRELVPTILDMLKKTHQKAYENMSEEEIEYIKNSMKKMIFNLTGSEDLDVQSACQ